MSGDPLDLDAIEARASDTASRLSLPTEPLRLAREDVPALVAEVRRLRALRDTGGESWRPASTPDVSWPGYRAHLADAARGDVAT